MSTLIFDQDDDECKLADYTSLNLDICVYFPEHKPLSLEELWSEYKRDECTKRVIMRVIDSDWKACTQAE